MKDILLIHHRLPYPLDNGMDKLRFNLIKTLSKEYKVTLIVPINKRTKTEYINEVKKIVDKLELIIVNDLETKRSGIKLFKLKRMLALLCFNTPFYVYENYYTAFKKAILNQINNNKYLFVQFLSDFCANYIMDIPKSQYKIVGPMDDMIETYRSYSNTIFSLKGRILNSLLSTSIKNHFKLICLKSDLVLFHSAQDAVRVKKSINLEFNYQILQVSTAFKSTSELTKIAQEPNTMVFVGGLGTFFNQDAVNYLVKEIFPLIQKKIKEAKLYIVGNNPPQSILNYKKNDQIIITGEVPDVDSYIQRATVYVSPVRIGTGIKTKIIEALSLKKAIVATNSSLQGLWNIENNILISDDAQGFADHVISLLENENLRKAYENKADETFNNYYALDKVEHQILNSYKNFLLHNN